MRLDRLLLLFRGVTAVVLATGWALAGDAHAATIAIDVGHALESPGASSARGRPEFEFNLVLARDIEVALAARGVSTLIVGGEGQPRALAERTRIARGAAFFLSIHHDSVQPQYLSNWTYEGVERSYSDRYSGFSLFVSRKNPALLASLTCASAIGMGLRKADFVPSLYHAKPIPGENKPFADRANGVHFYDNLVVLKSAAFPAVLFEAGVIVNRDEELVLARPETRRRIAEGVSQGLAACLRLSKGAL
jgi:N-acetylmuramoyl-L-alanine amidase